jgi:hypothetical protein
MMISCLKKMFGAVMFGACLLLPACTIGQQGMQPGFDAAEYADLLQMNFVMMADTMPVNNEYFMNKGSYIKLFRSPVVGLFNRCEIYRRNDNTGIISLRGTVGTKESWLENFYMAMVKAKGHITIKRQYFF